MLTRPDVLRSIADGELEVGYAFDCTTLGTCTRLSVEGCVSSALDTTTPADRMFTSNFFGDRLGLSLGPVVRSHRRRQPLGRHRFKGRVGTVDLWKSDSKLTVAPGELLTVQTVERIKLGSGLAAIVLPRLTLATAGLQIAPSYIDPGWDGILQLALMNASDEPYSITCGERIAICRFYSVSGPVSPDHIARFPQKSHHFGLTWSRVLDTDDDPLPMRKQPVKRKDIGSAIAWLHGVWRYVLSGVSALAIVSGLLWLGNRSADVDRAVKLADRVDMQEATVREAQRLLRDFEERLPLTGTTRASFLPGATTAVVTATLRTDGRPRPPVVVAHAQGASAVVASARVIGQTSQDVTIEISLTRVPSTEAADLTVGYALL